MLPAFDKFTATFPGAQPFAEAAHSNYLYWKALQSPQNSVLPPKAASP